MFGMKLKLWSKTLLIVVCLVSCDSEESPKEVKMAATDSNVVQDDSDTLFQVRNQDIDGDEYLVLSNDETAEVDSNNALLLKVFIVVLEENVEERKTYRIRLPFIPGNGMIHPYIESLVEGLRIGEQGMRVVKSDKLFDENDVPVVRGLEKGKKVRVLVNLEEQFSPQEYKGITYYTIADSASNKIEKGKQVAIHYNSYLLNQKKLVFSTSGVQGRPHIFTYGKDKQLPGLEALLELANVGDEFIAIFPPEMAYGDKQFSDMIPANSTLVYHITMVGQRTPK